MPRTTKAKHDYASLKRIGEKISKSGNAILAVAATMKRDAIVGLEIPNQTELDRSLRAQDNFVRSAERALFEYLQGNGAFVAPQEKLEQKIRQLEADLAKATTRLAAYEGKSIGDVAEQESNYEEE